MQPASRPSSRARNRRIQYSPRDFLGQNRSRMLPLDPAAALALAACFALLFVTAGAHKLRDRARFQGALAAYGLLPAASLGAVAVLLPVVELACGAALLVPGSRSGAALIGAGLLITYAAAMGINLTRGRRDLDCGCLGFGRGQTISGALLWRNGLLATALLGLALLGSGSRALGLLDSLTVAGATTAAALLYASADALLEVGRRFPRTVQGRGGHPARVGS